MTRALQQDHVGRAIAWLLFGVSGGLALDLCAKELLRTYSLQEFILLRSGIALAIFVALAPRMFGGFKMLRTRRWRWHALRSLLAVGAMFGFFYGLSKMPLVNALTLAFTAPLMMTVLSIPFLGEHVGWHRWMAVLVGFVGTLIMLRPGSSDFSLASVAVLIAALCYAGQAITARHLATTESTLALTMYVIVGPLVFSSAFMNSESWLTPDAKGWALLAAAGACSVVAWVGLTNGYRGASPALLAPLEYTALIGGAIAGYLIWGEVPDRWVVIGAATIIASGLYVVYRGLSADVARHEASDL